MNASLMRTICGITIAGCLFVVCKVVSSDDSSTSIETLKLQDGEVSGWKANSGDGYVAFNSSNMEALVNGGSIDFTSKGMVEGFQQNMTKDGTERTVRSWVLDFGTSEKAGTMFNERAQKLAAKKETAAPTFTESEAFLTMEEYGYSGYAHFGKYMITMWFDGYGSNKSEAKSNLLDFLNVEKQKINKQK